LPRRFFARPVTEVAPDLLGRILVRQLADGERLVARVVECEAYRHDDPASHSFRGPTARNRVMFGPAGYLYVYFVYGVHHCMNVVTGRAGEGSAVLLRAAEPLDGLDEMRRRRGRDVLHGLCAGPGRLCQALGIDRSLDGADLVRGREVWITAGDPVDAERVRSGPRVGIRVGIQDPWRFHIAGDPFVS
jgi:DNA-3-methyladenine glycosylase